MNFTIGDRDYEVRVAHFSPPTPASYGLPEDSDPGDGGEIDLSPFVDVSLGPDVDDVVTLETFLLELAIDRGVGVDAAREYVEETAMQAECESRHDY